MRTAAKSSRLGVGATRLAAWWSAFSDRRGRRHPNMVDSREAAMANCVSVRRSLTYGPLFAAGGLIPWNPRLVAPCPLVRGRGRVVGDRWLYDLRWFSAPPSLG